ncbi:unnamed protein product [Cylicocyclus nassatus]|uniref:Uncharacterized protein n=1 Tax=Cylicocyclus nassatus TaxID=53992 RepID=A0AA36DW14_CYLNA|nr:unnamed protein product [Cylicocyclus nassatus]
MEVPGRLDQKKIEEQEQSLATSLAIATICQEISELGEDVHMSKFLFSAINGTCRPTHLEEPWISEEQILSLLLRGESLIAPAGTSPPHAVHNICGGERLRRRLESIAGRNEQ